MDCVRDYRIVDHITDQADPAHNGPGWRCKLLCYLDVNVVATRFELAASASQMHERSVDTDAVERVTSSEKAACTTACTRNQESVQVGTAEASTGDNVETIAAQALKLSKADRQQLLVILAGSLGEP